MVRQLTINGHGYFSKGLMFKCVYVCVCVCVWGGGGGYAENKPNFCVCAQKLVLSPQKPGTGNMVAFSIY